MKQVVCPECGSEALRHLTDAYVVRIPFAHDDGTIELLEFDTEEYAEFFECRSCGLRKSSSELASSAAPTNT